VCMLAPGQAAEQGLGGDALVLTKSQAFPVARRVGGAELGQTYSHPHPPRRLTQLRPDQVATLLPRRS
jgi:hypothetical protein